MHDFRYVKYQLFIALFSVIIICLHDASLQVDAACMIINDAGHVIKNASCADDAECTGGPYVVNLDGIQHGTGYQCCDDASKYPPGYL